MDDEARALAELVERAKGPEAIFGDATAEEIRTIWRKFAAILHPDRFRDVSTKTRMQTAFVRAATLKEEAERRLTGITVKTKRHTYVVTGVFARGDLSELRACTDENGVRAVFKVCARSPDNDLLENEATRLQHLVPKGTLDEKFFRYLPRLDETFVSRGEDGVDRRVNVVSGFFEHVTMSEVMAAHPRGVDFRDAAWMTKRLLATLGFVHRRGLVHGAVLPPHLLVHPVNHGARLVDWCYAREIGDRIRAIPSSYRGFYPPEVLEKKPATAQTDIYLAAKTALALMGEKAPLPVHKFWSTCLAPSPSRRPDDAWALHDELEDVLERLVGKPKYRPLVMPARA